MGEAEGNRRAGAGLDLLVGLAVLGLAVICWQKLPRPVLPILLLASAGCLWLAVRRRGVRAPAVVAGSMLLVLAVAEGGAWYVARRGAPRKRPPPRSGTKRTAAPWGVMLTKGPPGTAPNGRRKDPLLGWSYVPDVEVTDRGRMGKKKDGAFINACLSTGPHGWRNGTRAADPSAPVALFFGDSYQFGLRLNDEDTPASLFTERSLGRYQGLNLAVDGWGPHQTVALLESRLEEPVLEGRRPFFGVYLSYFDPQRPVGAHGWAQAGPAYEVVSPGNLRRVADLGNVPPVLRWLRRSVLFQRVEPALRSTRNQDELYLELLVRSQRVFEERYGAPFLVVLCGRKKAGVRFDRMLERLEGRGVAAVAWEDQIPDHAKRWGSYHVAGDWHPTRLANIRIAEFLIQRAEAEGRAHGTLPPP